MVNSRQKGKRGELELCKVLNHHYPWLKAKRGVQFKGSPDSPDVSTVLDGLVHFECKRVEKLDLHSAMEQAKKDAGESVPVVCHRKNGEEWLLTVPLAFLDELAVSVVFDMNRGWCERSPLQNRRSLLEG